MKKLLIALLLMWATSASAATVQLVFEWDANTEADLSGYRLYQSEISGQYQRIADNPNSTNFLQQVGLVTTTTEIIEIDPNDARHFCLTAINSRGQESLMSNEVTFFLSPDTPGLGGPAPPVFRLRSWGLASSKP